MYRTILLAIENRIEIKNNAADSDDYYNDNNGVLDEIPTKLIKSNNC
jgi:hypothetical protein